MPALSFPSVGRLGLTSPPYRPVHSVTDLRYYDRLRLPIALLGSLSLSLLVTDTLPAPSLRLSLRYRSYPTTPGYLFYRSTLFSGILARRQLALPSSRVTPLNACPALRPRWYPENLPSRAFRTAAFRTNACRRLSLPLPQGVYPIDHNYTYFGALSRSLHPRFIQLRTPVTRFARGCHYWPVGSELPIS